MTDYEKLRENLARNIDADLWPMLDVARCDGRSLAWREREGGKSLKKAGAAMALILAAMQEPTDEMQSAVRLVNRKHERPTEMKGSFIPIWNELFLLPSTEDYAFGLLYKAALNTSPLVKPDDKT